MTTTITESQTQSFIGVFQQLGKAFQELSKNSIIPNKLFQVPTEGKEKDIKDMENMITKNIKKGGNMKSLGMKTRLGSVGHKMSNDIKIDEGKEKGGESEKDILNNDDEYESVESDDDYSEESNISSNTMKTGLIFVNKQGWEFKMKICNFLVEMGPFISQKKAKSTINFIKKNEPLLRKMSLSERKRWIKSLSSLIETLLV